MISSTLIRCAAGRQREREKLAQAESDRFDLNVLVQPVRVPPRVMSTVTAGQPSDSGMLASVLPISSVPRTPSWSSAASAALTSG